MALIIVKQQLTICNFDAFTRFVSFNVCHSTRSVQYVHYVRVVYMCMCMYMCLLADVRASCIIKSNISISETIRTLLPDILSRIHLAIVMVV